MPTLPPLHKKTIFIGLLIILFAGLLFKFFHKTPHSKAIPVAITKVSTGNISPTFDAVGNVTTKNNVQIQTQVNGQLIQIPVNPGQEVQQNQLLFAIDPRPFQAQVDQAKANLKKDQAGAENANKELMRYQKLVKQSYISKEYFDQIKSNAKTTKATVEADQATLQNANLQLAYTQIRAPISGRLSDINVKIGDLVNTSSTTPLTTINQFKPINVQFSLPSQDLPTILSVPQMDNIKVTATTDTQQNYQAAGKLEFINNQIDQTTGSIEMKAIFPNDDEKLWPGEFVKVHINIPNIAHAVLVPTIALQQNQQQQYYAYIVDDHNRAHQRLVNIGLTEGDNTSILSGLQPGEKIIVKGQFEVADNSLVNPTEIR